MPTGLERGVAVTKRYLPAHPLGTSEGETDGHSCIDDYQLLVSNAAGIPLAA
jgi:hypothetical protein